MVHFLANRRSLTQPSPQLSTCYCRRLRETLRPGDSFKCGQCGNGMSDEEVDDPSANGPLDVSPPPPSQRLNTMERTTAGAKKVQEIFKQIKATTSSGSTTNNQRRSTSVSSARGEAIASFTSGSGKAANFQKLARGPTPFPALATRKGRGGTTIAAKTIMPRPPSRSVPHPIASTSGFRVNSVVILVCGTNKYGEVRETKAPSSQQFINLRNCGCVIQGKTTGNSSGMQLERSWSKEDIDNQVQNWFPQVFTYVRRMGLHRQHDAAGNLLPWFRLLNKSGTSLSVVETNFPTGDDLFEHKGREKGAIVNRQIWFVTRNRIPKDIYDSWNTQPVIAGSDSELDDPESGDEGVVEITDDEVQDTNENQEIDQIMSSSLLSLNFSSQPKESKDKLKAIVKTPPKVAGKRRRVVLSPTSDSPSYVSTKKIKEFTAHPVPLFQPVASGSGSQHPISGTAAGNGIDVFSAPTASSSGVVSRISSPPAFVTVSEQDMWLRNQLSSNDPDAPMTNPWATSFVMINADVAADIHN